MNQVKIICDCQFLQFSWTFYLDQIIEDLVWRSTIKSVWMVWKLSWWKTCDISELQSTLFRPEWRWRPQNLVSLHWWLSKPAPAIDFVLWLFLIIHLELRSCRVVQIELKLLTSAYNFISAPQIAGTKVLIWVWFGFPWLM